MSFAERNQKIVEMAKEGQRPQRIAPAVGTSVHVCYRVLHKARKCGETIPYFTTHGDATERQFAVANLPQEIIAGLAPHARRRGIGPEELAARIIELVVDSDLVNAVMDDGVR